MSSRMVVADDDRAIRESLGRTFRLDGHEVALVSTGAEALDAMRRTDTAIGVLDVMMPELSGLEVCATLRAEGNNVPILMLTAMTQSAERVAGLDAGADDYVTKPFDMDELRARVRALLRRSQSAATQPLPVGSSFVLDPVLRSVKCAEQSAQLTKTEFDLLSLLAEHIEAPLSRAEIYARIWQYDFGPESRNLAIYIGYLRRKLAAVECPMAIDTIRGLGYVLRRR